jgi:flagellar basal body P-ring protein FlgI
MHRAAWMKKGRLMSRTAFAVILLALGGCAKVKEAALVVPPPPTYRGPAFLRGTIASVAELRGYEPRMVSGYGVVVDLNGTGSPDCPPALRAMIHDQMRKGGFGQVSLGLGDRTPAAELASGRVAVVKVTGIVPPGATKASRFDLQVEALENSSTRSLEGGRLYTLELELGEPVPNRKGFVVAEGRGPVLVNPFIDPEQPAEDINDPRRIGTVPAGGVVLRDMDLTLVTTRPSLQLVQQITDRINTRFQPDRTDSGQLATPLNESTIRLRVLNRFRDDPQRMLDLLSHIFLDPRPLFAQERARQMAELLADPQNHLHADDVALTWEAMGSVILPIIREHYGSTDGVVQRAALQAGAGLGDAAAVDPLRAIAQTNEGRRCEQATVLLGRLLKARPDRPQITVALRKLLDHDDPLVRLAAYEALASVDDETITRYGFEGKMEVSQVRCQKPMIYATRSGPPRIIIFNDQLAFQSPVFFSMWENKFMLQSAEQDGQLRVFYKRPGRPRPTIETIPANVSYFTGVLAFNPNRRRSTTPGLDFTYNRIVSVLHRLTERGHIDAPLVMQQDTLSERIRRLRITDPPSDRPDTVAGSVSAKSTR